MTILKIDRDVTTDNFIVSIYIDNGFICNLIDIRFNAYPNWFKKHIKETHFRSELIGNDSESNITYYNCIFK